MKVNGRQAQSQGEGRSVIIGGAEDKQGECKILREFIRMAGGRKSHVTLMTVATDKADEVTREYKSVFRRLGVERIDAVDVSSRDAASSPAALNTIRRSTGIFFSGGDQLHITSLLGGSPMDDLLHEQFEKGAILAGTSAGASMLANAMIISGKADINPQYGALEMAPAMEFVPGILIDVHFSQRGRLGRLLTAIAHYPHDIGVGIDENTAIVAEGRQFRVLGEGGVVVIDGSGATYSNLVQLKQGETLTFCGVRMHVLGEGFAYDVKSRTPLVNGGSSKSHEPSTPKKRQRAMKQRGVSS